VTWRTGTKNPHALYYDMGGVSVPHGFIMHPDVARRIVDAMDAGDLRARQDLSTETMLELRDQGVTPHEIGKRLGCTRSAVKWRLSRVGPVGS
jgi:hypothetical protein